MWLKHLFPVYLFSLFLALAMTAYIGSSYWLDELYSVTASNLGVSEMITLIINDVHPPLYQLILTCWIRIFGDTPFATRALSLSFSLLALSIFFLEMRKHATAQATIVGLLFLVTNKTFLYYSLETRSYSLMLLLSTVVFFMTVKVHMTRKVHLNLCMSIMALSLTHFFGMLFSLISVFSIWFVQYSEQKKIIIRDITLLFLSLTPATAWMLTFIVEGGLDNAGGTFWIQVDSPLSTLSIQMSAPFPWLREVAMLPYYLDFENIAGTSILKAVLKIGCFLIMAKMAFVILKEGSTLSRLAVFFTAMIVLVPLIIDIHTPVSTPKNYIILLVPVAVIFSIYAQARKSRYLFYIAFFTSTVVAFSDSAYHLYKHKFLPLEDWDSASKYMLSDLMCNGRDACYYFDPENAETGDFKLWNKLVFNYYIAKLDSSLALSPTTALRPDCSPTLIAHDPNQLKKALEFASLHGCTTKVFSPLVVVIAGKP
jgi:uncharacterized membrane protein